MHRLALGLLLVLCSCAPEVSGNSAGGIASTNSNAGSFSAADQHCHQYGKVARMGSAAAPSGPQSSLKTWSFECVAP